MAEVDLKEKFPNMTPIKSAPSLSTINGIGFRLYGSRDADAYTGTDEPYLFGRSRVSGPDPARRSYRSHAAFRAP